MKSTPTSIISPEVLDCTVRDGSYTKKSIFTLSLLEKITVGLSKSGIRKVEIGHGFGLGGNRTMDPMPVDDLAALDHLVPLIRDTQLGMFCFPGLGTSVDIKNAAAHGLGFLRIGFFGEDSPHPLSQALPLMEVAREQGLWVSANAVRTQLIPTREVVKIAQQAEKSGAHCFYIVDSTGGNTPSRVSEMVRAVREFTDLEVGFHGHDNFRLAIANSLAAVEAGAHVVDGTLRGIGRDAGNAQLEILVAGLQKMGFLSGISLERVEECALATIASVFPSLGVPLDLVRLARYDLMTHGLPLIRGVAREANIDWTILAEAFCKSGSSFEEEANLRLLAHKLGGLKTEFIPGKDWLAEALRGTLTT